MSKTDLQNKLTIITANIGSFFPYDESLVKQWIAHILSVIEERNSELLVLHFQEFGHKRVLNRHECEMFVNELKEGLLQKFDNAIMFSDMNADDPTRYTKFQYETDDVESVAKRIKFELDLFPLKKYSRKGFTAVRLKISDNNKQRTPLKVNEYTFVNLHLIHDLTINLELDNMHGPNKYSPYRIKQLTYVLDWLKQHDSTNNVIAGDFNFRSHSYTLANSLLSNGAIFTLQQEGDSEVVVVKHNDIVVLRCDKKTFQLQADYTPKPSNFESYRKGDIEYNNFQHSFTGFEYPITFLPSYCFAAGDGKVNNKSYYAKRCPSYCDRIILFGSEFIEHVKKDNPVETTTYTNVKSEEFIGDHQPVFLHLNLS